MILTITICPFWLLTKCSFLSFKLHQQKIIIRFPFGFSTYLSHIYGSSIQFLLIFFFSCIDSQSQSIWSPTIFSFSSFIFFLYSHSTMVPNYFFFFLFFFSQPQSIWWSSTTFNFFFFHSHSQNNSLPHHQLVFYFMFKRKKVKSKSHFFMVDLNLRKIR